MGYGQKACVACGAQTEGLNDHYRRCSADGGWGYHCYNCGNSGHLQSHPYRSAARCSSCGESSIMTSGMEQQGIKEGLDFNYE